MLPGNRRNLTAQQYAVLNTSSQRKKEMADDDDEIDKEIARLVQLKKEKAELKKKQELEAKAKEEEEQRIAAEQKKREDERALLAAGKVEGGGEGEAEEARWRSFYETLLAREVATAGFSFWVDDKPPEQHPTEKAAYPSGLLYLQLFIFIYDLGFFAY